MDRCNSVHDILKISRRYVFYLCDKSVGNLDSQETREVVMVSTYMRGAVIPISFSRFSYHLITETWIYSTHASWFYKSLFWVLVDIWK